MEMLMTPLSESLRVDLEAAIASYEEQLEASEPAMEYLLSRGLTKATIKKFRLGFAGEPMQGHEAGKGRLAVPYLTSRGPVKMRFRVMPEHEGGAKYLDLAGAQTRMFNVQALVNDPGGDTCFIAEGEFDAMVADQCGLTAIGLAGVSAWKPHFALLLEGYEKVRILADNDDKGQGAKLGEEIASKMPGHDVRTILMPPGFDVNSAYVDGGKEHLLDWINGTF